MKKIRQRNQDFANQFNNLTLKDTIQTTDKSISIINQILEIKRIYNIKTPKNVSFLQRMLELPSIIPKRYVWHVGGGQHHLGGSDVETFSIATEGFKSGFGKYNVVFANNNSYYYNRFFPFIDDLVSDPLDPSVDYWRIDTHAFDAKWYVDPNMLGLLTLYYDDPTDYICTSADIPAHALKLFHYPEKLYKHYDPQSLLDYCIYDTRVLEPDNRVNWWIRKKALAA